MTESLGKCSICGAEAHVLYPLLPRSPAFCSKHHNPRDAGRFGCDFSGHDDLDILFDEEDVFFHTPRSIRLTRRSFVWTDICGVSHKLKDIDDSYLSNIVHYLERGEGHVREEVGRERLIRFLKNEQYRRISA